jgi:hypothetical protein
LEKHFFPTAEDGGNKAGIPRLLIWRATGRKIEQEKELYVQLLVCSPKVASQNIAMGSSQTHALANSPNFQFRASGLMLVRLCLKQSAILVPTRKAIRVAWSRILLTC